MNTSRQLDAAATRQDWLTIGALILLVIGLRAPGFDRPLTGNFATKAAVYGMVARNWALGRASLWYPTVDVVAHASHELDVDPDHPAAPPRSLHMLEFPASAYLVGMAWLHLGGTLDAWGRVVSIACSAVSAGLLYSLVRRWHGATAARAAALVFALSPVSVIYGQCFMLEAPLVMYLLGGMFAMDRWLTTGRSRWLALTAMTLMLLLLTKVYMLVFLGPLAAMPWNQQLRASRRIVTLVVLALTGLPGLLWSWHVFRTAAPGSPLVDQLYYSFRQSVEVHAFPHPLLFSTAYYLGLAKDLGTIVLTPLGGVLLMMGWLHPSCRQHRQWLLACAALLLALPLKFAQMNYYFLPLLPLLCICAGLGWERACNWISISSRTRFAILAIGLLLSLRYSIRPSFITADEDRVVVAAGKAAQGLLAADEPVVTMHGSTIDLLYYCDHKGWAISPHQDWHCLAATLKDCGIHGGRFIVVAGHQQFERNPESRDLLQTFPLVCHGDDYWIYRMPSCDSDWEQAHL